MRRLLILLLLLGGCAHGAGSPAPRWLQAGSGARFEDGGRALYAVAFVRLAPGEVAPSDAVDDRVRYVVTKQARRLVVRMRQAAQGQPERARRVLGPGEAAETLEALRDRVAQRARRVGRYRGEDGAYFGVRIDVDALIADVTGEQPDVARWLEEGFRTLESEDSTAFLGRR